jgi:hypothetical protein
MRSPSRRTALPVGVDFVGQLLLAQRKHAALGGSQGMNRHPRRRRHEGRPIEGRPNAKTFRIRKPYLQFYGTLESLNHHFDNWLLPREPEEAAMTRVILALQNILEYEAELVIAVVASRVQAREIVKSRIEEDYASFKEKFTWLRVKGLISEADEKVMEEIRKIRNKHAHWRPSTTRRKLKYFDTALLTRKAVRKIFMDVQPIVEKLRGISGSTETLAVIPWPGFFDEAH